jgi:aarF domain-containing kinase
LVPPCRYAAIGIVRCTRVVVAVIGAMWDYKTLFAKTWTDDPAGRAQRHQDYHTTHLTAAHRILEVLKKNGGIYVKLGQHLSSIQLIPIPWSATMKPLQDQCTPSSFHMINQLFLNDVGQGIQDLFHTFDPVPIGVASLAQVHRAVDRKSGRLVAVKVMHPTLEEYLEVDTSTVVTMLRFVKWVFPEFEFTWLGEVSPPIPALISGRFSFQ